MIAGNYIELYETVLKLNRTQLPFVKSMAIVGSVARCEQTPKSDIDILIDDDGRVGTHVVRDFVRCLLRTKRDVQTIRYQANAVLVNNLLDDAIFVYGNMKKLEETKKDRIIYTIYDMWWRMKKYLKRKI